MDVSLVIPAYNESARLGATLDSVIEQAATGSFGTGAYEVIVVCDGCTDDTEAVARSYTEDLPLHVVAYPGNRGKGHAVRVGVAATIGSLVVFMDADGATPVSELPRLATPIRLGQADIVVASRRAPGARLAVPQPWYRRWLGLACSLHTRFILGIRVLDTQCGFKVFRGDLGRALFAALEHEGFACDIELLWIAHRCGARVQEVGVEWRDVPGSSVSPLRDGLRMLAAIWRLRLQGGNQAPAARSLCRDAPR